MLILCLEILWQPQIMHATMDQFHILTIWRKKFQLNGFTSIHYSFRKFFLDRERVSMGIKLSRGPHEHLAGAITVTIIMLDLLWYSVYLCCSQQQFTARPIKDIVTCTVCKIHFLNNYFRTRLLKFQNCLLLSQLDYLVILSLFNQLHRTVKVSF